MQKETELKIRTADEFQHCKVMSPWEKKILTLNMQRWALSHLCASRNGVLGQECYGNISSMPTERKNQTKPLPLLASIKPWCVLVLNTVGSPAAPLKKGHNGTRKDAQEGSKDHEACANSFRVKNEWSVSDPLV